MMRMLTRRADVVGWVLIGWALTGCGVAPAREPDAAAKSALPSWRARQARTVDAFSFEPWTPASQAEVLILDVMLVRSWAVGAKGCPTAATRSDLQLSLGSEPPQSILLHDFVGDLQSGEVVTAGSSARSPEPPKDAVFHVTAQTDHVLGEVFGVRVSEGVVAVYSNAWLVSPTGPCAARLVASRVVGELDWPVDRSYRVTTGMLAGAQETAEEVASRFPFCRSGGVPSPARR